MKEVNENLKNLKIIIGKDGYDEQNIKCTKNELTSRNSCRQFYRHFETVAFVTREKVPFKRTFEHILNLLYYKKNINVRKKYESITQDWISFVECMFNNESIVFINQDELDHHNKNHKYIIENAHAILMCGKWSQQGGNPLHFSLHFYVLSCCETQSACFNDYGVGIY
ncbi:hypothetical protein [Mammaliicoccus vitulinus]|uniref:hypothetical protein n=1 Tax=Mammaliicoccus vitulinus TaxID=71237 RepID=UPI003F958E93